MIAVWVQKQLHVICLSGEITLRDIKVSDTIMAWGFNTYQFFISHTLSSFVAKWKVVVIAVFFSKLDHRPLFNYICYETVVVWGLVSLWITNASHCL